MPILILVVLGTFGFSWVLDYFTDGNSTYNIVYFMSDKMLDIAVGLFSVIDIPAFAEYSVVDLIDKLPDTMLQVMTMLALPQALGIIVSGYILRGALNIISSFLPFFK